MRVTHVDNMCQIYAHKFADRHLIRQMRTFFNVLYGNSSTNNLDDANINNNNNNVDSLGNTASASGSGSDSNNPSESPTGIRDRRWLEGW